MQVSQAMSQNIRVITPSATLVEAAQEMEEIDCGFLPIGTDPSANLQGVITDRDIVTRAIAKGLDPAEVCVGEIKSDKVLYCFEDDDIEVAAESMHDQQVYRLVVLNNRDEKHMVGVISLGDITRSHHPQDRSIAGYVTEGMKEAAL